MMSLNSMPVGYRFHPSDQELVNHYLKFKNQGLDPYVSNIQQIDVCKWEPWELAEHLGSELDDQEWYFFGRRDSKYVKGTRSNRSTKHGFWKPTGKDRYIRSKGSKKIIGTKKTLVFHKGSAKKAVSTQWVMHEYRASVDKDNPQAFVLYRLKNKSDDSPELPISDEADPNISPPSASLLNSHYPSSPTVFQGSAHFSHSDQSRLTQNGKEQDVSFHPQNYLFDSANVEDDTDFQALLEGCFGGQSPTRERLDELLPPIPLADIYPSQELSHMTAGYLNVSNNDGGVTQFHNINREVKNIVSASSILMRTRENVPPVSESASETDNDVPQSLFGEDAVHGGSACHSDSESSDQEFYNDMILAHDTGSDQEGAGLEKPIILGAHGSAVTNPRTRTYSQVLAQAEGHKYGNVPSKKSERKIQEAASDESYVESLFEAKSRRIPEGSGIKPLLGKNNHNMGFIAFAENPRVNHRTTPPSNYIMNIAIGIFLTVVITGEVLFGLVGQ